MDLSLVKKVLYVSLLSRFARNEYRTTGYPAIG